MREWKPLLADYLTSSVGPLYDPPISFRLVPMEWDANSTAESYTAQGLLDFACMSCSDFVEVPKLIIYTSQMLNEGS